MMADGITPLPAISGGCDPIPSKPSAEDLAEYGRGPTSSSRPADPRLVSAASARRVQRPPRRLTYPSIVITAAARAWPGCGLFRFHC